MARTSKRERATDVVETIRAEELHTDAIERNAHARILQKDAQQAISKVCGRKNKARTVRFVEWNVVFWYLSCSGSSGCESHHWSALLYCHSGLVSSTVA